MALFQHSVIKKYIQELDKASVKESFVRFTKYFGDPQRQQNIRDSKEEQFQEGFLRSLFVDILGYTLNPEPNYNLLTEQKNEKDSKKADGAILQNGAIAPQVIAVIELKGTDTTDLSKVENQAFSYKNNQKSCIYVITSNFEKLRFYIDNAIDFEEFNLFNLSEERFQLLFLCLAKDNLLNGIPQKIKEASVSKEEQITKQLYADYSAFKRFLYQNLVKLNPQFDKLTLFKKTQKLLDRFLFVFFAEDRLLLPPNSIREIVKQWQQLKDLDNYIPLYDRFIKYFGYMNVGFKGKQYEIFAYNGGLFAPDKILDNIKIDDTVLFEHTIKLSDYDYDTEVDVNILGHIFEHSLNEIEEIQSEIEGKELDKSNTKRKKDGIFYTPKYITKYIVENTVGTLCTEKKKELGINEEEIVISKRISLKKELIQKIDTYRNWLLKLAICDPACGSGAFLNQALDFLIIEHRKLDELKARITNSPIIFSDYDNSVLENNIFGVDLNDEAVEIAKLSLWLKTAHKGRKLSVLSSNIKCGNSLIDDKTVAGEKAFNWQNEFPDAFANGGFDVVIGNPPYTYRNSITEKEKKYFENTYISNEGNFDLYKFFIEKGILLNKKNGLFSFITSSSFLIQISFTKLRKLILDNTSILELIPLGPSIFEEATVDTSIFVLKKEANQNEISIGKPKIGLDILKKDFQIIKKDRFINNNNFLFDCNLSDVEFNILSRLENKFRKIEDDFDVGVGINTGYIKNELVSDKKISEKYHPMVAGNGISRFGDSISNNWIMYDKEYIKSRGDLGRSLPLEKYFNNDKIFIVRTRNLSIKRRIVATFDDQKKYNLNRLSNIISKNNNSLKGLLAVINSSFFNWLFSTKYLDYEIKPVYLKKCPIPNVNDNSLIAKSELMLSKNKLLFEIKTKFIKILTSKFSDLKINNKLEDWNLLDYTSFSKELSKQKIKLSLSDQSEWLDFFEKEKTKATEIQNEIKKIDKEIDKMVYELYDLTEDEIKIIEK